jgi:hypothetical protein
MRNMLELYREGLRQLRPSGADTHVSRFAVDVGFELSGRLCRIEWFKVQVKIGGQECPPHTGLSRFVGLQDFRYAVGAFFFLQHECQHILRDGGVPNRCERLAVQW